jgi:hypothetical protein
VTGEYIRGVTPPNADSSVCLAGIGTLQPQSNAAACHVGHVVAKAHVDGMTGAGTNADLGNVRFSAGYDRNALGRGAVQKI